MAEALRDPFFGDDDPGPAPEVAPSPSGLVDPFFGGTPTPEDGGLRIKIGAIRKPSEGLSRVLDVGSTAFNKGLADFAGMPVDLATAALNLFPKAANAMGADIPSIQKPYLGSEHLAELLNSAGMIGSAPEGPIENLYAGMAHEIGANVLPVGQMLRAAGKPLALAASNLKPQPPAGPPGGPASILSTELPSVGARAGASLQKGVSSITDPTLWEPLIHGARSAPGGFAAGQMAGAAGAGAGSGLAQDIIGSDETNPTMKMGANLLGGLVGGVAPLAGIEGGRALMRAMPLTRGQQELAAARKLDIRPEQQLTLNHAQEAAPQIPGVNFTTADLLNDQGLLARQRGLQRSGPEAVADANNARVNNAAGYQAFVGEAAPGGDTGAPKAAAREKVQEIQGRRQQGLEQATTQASDDLAATRAAAMAAEMAAQQQGQQNVTAATAIGDRSIDRARTAAAQPLGEGVPAERKAAASGVARGEIETARNEAQSTASDLFRQVDPDGTITTPTTPIARESREIVREAISRGRPDAIPDIIVSGEIERYLGNRPIREIEGLRQRLGELIRKEHRAPDSSAQKISFLERLKGSVDDVYETMAGETPASRPSVATAISDADVERVLNEQRANWYAERGIEQPAVSRMAGGDRGTGSTGGSGRVLRGSGTRESGFDAAAEGPGTSGAGRDGTPGAGGASSAPEDIAAAGERYRVARDFFAKNVARPFRQGVVKDILATGSDNLPKTKASDTLNKVVNPASGKPEAVEDFVRAVGGRPQAEAALLDYAVADIADFARNPAGQLVSTKLAAWREKHAPVLQAFPEVEAVLSNVQRLQGRVDQIVADAAAHVSAAETAAKVGVKTAKEEGAQAVKRTTETGRANVKAEAARKQATQRELDKSAAKFWLDESPSNAIDSVLNSGDPVKAARQTLAITHKGGAEARRGIAQAAWENVVQRIFSGVEGEGLKVATTKKFLDKNRDALRILLGGDAQLQKLDDLYRAAEINSRTSRAAVRGGSDTAQNQASRAVDVAKRSLSTILGGGTGAVFGGPVGAVLGGAAGAGVEALARHQRELVTRLAGQALADPEVFRLLTQRVTKENEKALAGRLKAQLANLGLRSGAALTAE